MSDNVAMLKGFTKEVFADADEGLCELHLLVRPDTELDTRFKAWDMDEQEWINVHGWMFTIEEVKA